MQQCSGSAVMATGTYGVCTPRSTMSLRSTPSSSSYLMVEAGKINSRVPRKQCPNYSLQQAAWNFASTTREESEKLLSRSCLRDGTFLVRRSAKYRGSYALSVKYKGTAQHYIIKNDNNGGLFIGLYEERHAFRTIEQLICYYRAAKNDLCCKLTDSCPKSALYDFGLCVCEIGRSSLVLSERLGKTDMEDMWCGIWLCGAINAARIPVFVRKMNPQYYGKADLVQETNIQCGFLHNNIVQLYGISTVREPMYVVSESLDNGSLLYFLREGAGRDIGFVQKMYLAAQIASGVDYLHFHLCLHRYLCTKNVFISKGGVAKIANFRYAKLLKSGSGTLRLPVEQYHVRWSPPEVLDSGSFSLKSDVWSFGMLLTEIVTNGKMPFSKISSREEVMDKIVIDRHKIPRSELSSECTESLHEVMKSCWRYEANMRPQFEFIITGLYDCIPLEKGSETLL